MADPEAAGATVARLLARIGTRTREVAVAIGGSSVFIRRLPLPEGDPGDPTFRDAVAREAARHVPFHIESLEFDYQISPNPAGGRGNGAPVPPPGAAAEPERAGVVFGAAPRAMVQAHCDAILHGGGRVTRVDLEPYALFSAARLEAFGRAFAEASSGASGESSGAGAAMGSPAVDEAPLAFVEVGAERTAAHVFARAPAAPPASNGAGPAAPMAPDPGDLLSSLEAPPGSEDHGARIAATLRAALVEAGVGAPLVVRLSGGAPVSPAAARDLSEAAGEPPAPLDPLARLRCPGDGRPGGEGAAWGPAFAIAAGLAFTQLVDRVAGRRSR